MPRTTIADFLLTKDVDNPARASLVQEEVEKIKRKNRHKNVTQTEAIEKLRLKLEAEKARYEYKRLLEAESKPKSWLKKDPTLQYYQQNREAIIARFKEQNAMKKEKAKQTVTIRGQRPYRILVFVEGKYYTIQDIDRLKNNLKSSAPKRKLLSILISYLLGI